MKLFRDILWCVIVASSFALIIGVIMSIELDLDDDTAALMMIGAEIGGITTAITVHKFD